MRRYAPCRRAASRHAAMPSERYILTTRDFTPAAEPPINAQRRVFRAEPPPPHAFHDAPRSMSPLCAMRDITPAAELLRERVRQAATISRRLSRWRRARASHDAR